MVLGSRAVGPARRPFCLAHTGAAHDGDLQLGYKLIETAGAAGADGVVVSRGILADRDFKCVLGHAGHVGLAVLGSPEDEREIALLDAMGVAGLRLSEAEDAPPEILIGIARTHRPLVLSLRRADLDRAERVLDACRAAGSGDVALLAPDPRMMETWQAALPGVPVGLLGPGLAPERPPAFHAYLMEVEHRLSTANVLRRPFP